MIGNLYKIIDREHLHRIAIDVNDKDILRILFEVTEPNAIEYEENEFSKHTRVYHITLSNGVLVSYFLTSLPISADIQVT